MLQQLGNYTPNFTLVLRSCSLKFTAKLQNAVLTYSPAPPTLDRTLRTQKATTLTEDLNQS